MAGKKTLAVGLSAALVLVVLAVPIASAQSVPDWVKKVALWYGQEHITETEFLDAIKFLIANDIIVLEDKEAPPGPATIVIPNGNANVEHTGFYIPLNLEVSKETTVVWVNEDSVPHTVQSIDESGTIIGLFNSIPLKTGERFSYDFDEPGIYHYYCSLHPWRVGQVTVR